MSDMAYAVYVLRNELKDGGEKLEAFPPAVIEALIAALIQQLATDCGFKNPWDAYAWLTQTVFSWLERLLGTERRREAAIRRAVGKLWQGPADQLPAVYAAVRAGMRDRLTWGL